MVSFIAACVQLNSQDDLEANIRTIETLTREAHGKGAEFIALPENALYMSEPGKGAHPSPEKALEQCKALAHELGVWILIGSAHVPAPHGRSWNRSLLINQAGKTVAHYDKIHLFDVMLEGGETYKESARFAGGGEAIIARTPWGALGMTVCYDLRFPHLYRALAHAGADFLAVPSAFTYTTGKAHWHVLLRARAIENGAYVFAPAQCGTHPGNRKTYGHSLIVDPWGEIIAEGSEDKTGIITAVINTDTIRQSRMRIPSLTHDQPFTIKQY